LRLKQALNIACLLFTFLSEPEGRLSGGKTLPFQSLRSALLYTPIWNKTTYVQVP